MPPQPSRYAPKIEVDRDERSDWIKIIGAIVGFTLIGVLTGVIDTARKAERADIVQVAPAILATPPIGLTTNTNSSP